MHLIRFIDVAGHTRIGRLLLEEPGRAEVMSGSIFDAKATGERVAIARMLSPVEPVNLFCIGLNYRKHAMETGAELPPHPVIFMKPTTAVISPGEAIRIPRCCEHGPEVDYECELAVVIGRTAYDVSESEALKYVLGYTIGNDVSARRWQRNAGGGQWIRGKSFDTFCPLGPAIVTADQIPDPQSLTLSTHLNGERMQHETSADMIFSVAQIIAYLSRDTRLLPGTVILTGTPSGVGVARKPPVYLKPGDSVTLSIPPIGELTNPVA